MQTTMNLGPNPSVARWRKSANLLGAAALTFGLSACAKEPTLVALSATTHNYSEDYLVDVWVGKKSAGSIIKPAKAGHVTGGGVLCCIKLAAGARSVTVEIKEADRNNVASTFATQARVRQPWPEIASYAVFNVLPGRRVLVEVVPGYLIPSGDRLAELEKAWRDAE